MNELRVVNSITAIDGDGNYYPNAWVYESNSLLIELLGLPSTWEFAGRVYKEVDLDNRENFQDWAIVESAELFPHGKFVVRWKNQTVPYRIKFRFVRYISDSTLTVREIDYDILSSPIDLTGLLDDYPGGTAFAIERLYSDYVGDTILTSNISVLELLSQTDATSIVLLPVDVVSTNFDYLYGSDASYLASDVSVSVGPEFVYATRFRVLSAYQGENIEIFGVSNNIDIRVRTTNELRARTRSDGGFVDINVAGFAFDAWHTLVFKVTQAEVELWMDGSKVGSVVPGSPLMSASAKLRLELKGIELKAGCLWQSPAVLPNPELVSISMSVL